MTKPTEKEYLTTFEVARLLGANSSSVNKWADAGIFKYHRTAGGSDGKNGHRRIARAEVRRYMVEKGIPLPEDMK